MKITLIVSILLALATTVWTWLLPRETVKAETKDVKLERLTTNGERVEPGTVASLRVSEPQADGSASTFEVKLDGSNWVIPTRYNYPADGRLTENVDGAQKKMTRVGVTSANVLNVPPGAKVTADPKKHADFGVLDPDSSTEKDGRGKRITLKDAGGAILVDLIIGKEAELAKVRYVRDARQNEVYTADIKPEISTSFKDWVEPDLLKISSADIRSVTIKDYSIDAAKGVIVPRSETPFSKPKDKTEWSTDKIPDGKIVNQESVGKLVSEVTGLRLTDIRPFNRMLLEQSGFYVGPDGSVYGKEGAVEIVLKDGVKYKLYLGSGAVTADGAKAPDAKADATASQNRYLFVLADYNAAADENKPPEPNPADAARQARATMMAGQSRAKRASQRFARFFYVISDDSFKKLRPAVAELFKEKPKEEPKKDEPKEGAAKPGGDFQLPPIAQPPLTPPPSAAPPPPAPAPAPAAPAPAKVPENQAAKTEPVKPPEPKPAEATKPPASK